MFFKKKCKVCKTKKDVQFYEVCEKETDRVLFRGDFCPKCIIVIASHAKSATFQFTNEDVNLTK